MDDPFNINVSSLAQYLFVVRGCKEGRDVANWLEAESELKCRISEEDISRAISEAPKQNLVRLLSAINGCSEPN